MDFDYVGNDYVERNFIVSTWHLIPKLQAAIPKIKQYTKPISDMCAIECYVQSRSSPETE